MDKKEKYKVIATTDNIYISFEKNFFQFGRCCFRIYDNCTSVNNNYINDTKAYYDIPTNYGLTGGDKNFTISSYEVYQIDL